MADDKPTQKPPLTKANGHFEEGENCTDLRPQKRLGKWVVMVDHHDALGNEHRRLLEGLVDGDADDGPFDVWIWSIVLHGAYMLEIRTHTNCMQPPDLRSGYWVWTLYSSLELNLSGSPEFDFELSCGEKRNGSATWAIDGVLKALKRHCDSLCRDADRVRGTESELSTDDKSGSHTGAS